jgi:predicted Kef-type K+ transport protein
LSDVAVSFPGITGESTVSPRGENAADVLSLVSCVEYVAFVDVGSTKRPIVLLSRPIAVYTLLLSATIENPSVTFTTPFAVFYYLNI